MSESARPLGITDVVLRDAHQSLFATRMRIDDMLPIAEKLDKIGFWSLESWGGATFDACIRYLGEDPWERIRALKEAMPNTPQQMLLRGQNLLGYRHYADDVVDRFVERAKTNGVDVFRVFDAMNDPRNLERAIQAVKANDGHAQGTISYTKSPVHTLDSWVELAKSIADMGADSLAIKDMAGLLTPYDAFELVTKLKSALNIRIHLHCHATTGLSSATALKAAEAGVDNVDTAISSMSMTYGHSPTESLVAMLKDTERDTGLDLEALEDIAAYFREVRKKYAAFEGSLKGIDSRILVAQVPGGMLTNMEGQLKEQGAGDRLDEVLKEIPRVREDLGYIPLVTPTSQIVGTQAVMNVLAGERYKTITNEVKRYLLGHYGAAPAPVDTTLQRRAVGNEEVIDQRPADLLPRELDKLRQDIGELAGNEEDVLTFAMFPDIGRAFLEERAGGTLKPEPLLPPDSGQAAGAEVAGQPTEFTIDVHGETYQVAITGVGLKGSDKRRFFLTLDGMPEEVIFEPLNAYQKGDGEGGRKQAGGPGDVTTNMPGNIVDVLVAEGDEVKAGQPVLVIEAMKMESEVQAPSGGTVQDIFVAKGDRVTPGEVLIEVR